MAPDVDVVVIGCGGLGAAVTAELARRGRSVVAFDSFARHHDRGSSHGTERIVRTAYTDATYASLGLEAIGAWRELERRTGRSLLRLGGGIDFGNSDELHEIAASCAFVGVTTEMLSPVDAMRRFPGFRFDTPVLFQPLCGTVNADVAVRTFGDEALTHGARLVFDHRVHSIANDGEVVVVRSGSEEVRARRVVVTTGAWADRLIDDLVGGVEGGHEFVAEMQPLTVTDEQVFFFRPRIESAWPTFIRRDVPEYYGLPTPDGLVKAGGHYTGRPIDPDHRDAVDPEARRAVSDWMRDNVPGVDPEPVASTTCLYASYPDEDFLVDRVGNVSFGVGLGGHGFKFLPVLARRLADLCLGEEWLDNPFTVVREARSVGPSGHK